MTKRIAALVAVLTGCSSAFDPGVPASGQDAPQAGAPDQSGAEIPGGPREEEKLQTPPPLLDWSFEPASADCNGWRVVGAEAIRASPSRSGAYSCKVCANGTAPTSVSLTREVGAAPAGRYVLTAWVRKRALTAAPEEAHARIEADTYAGEAIVSGIPRSVVHEEWELLQTTLDLTADPRGVARLSVIVGSPSAEAQRCLFIDDVTLRREP